MDGYLSLDRLIREKFGADVGVGEYISRLGAVKDGEPRGDVPARLARYRAIRNSFAHEAGALSKSREVRAEDIRWLRGFCRDVKRGRDPLTKYEKKFKKERRARRIRVTLWLVFALAVCLAVGAVVLGAMI